MKISYFLGKNNLKSFFRPGWKGMGDPVWRRWRPDLRETGTRMWSCLSALFEEILCTVSDYNPVDYLCVSSHGMIASFFIGKRMLKR